MFSPALRHRQRVLAALSGQAVDADRAAPPAEPDAGTAQGQEYFALRVLLHDNLRTISDVQSIEARNPMKAEFAKAFAPWIEGVLAAGYDGPAAQDEILIQNMIWAIDTRDFDYALLLGDHALRHKLAMPERFNRGVACFLLEEMAELSLAQHELITLEQLLRVEEMATGHDMPDQARAKMCKAISRSWQRRAEAFDPAADNAPAGAKAGYIEAALNAATRAFALDHGVGVKKDIERLTGQLKKLAEAGPALQGTA